MRAPPPAQSPWRRIVIAAAGSLLAHEPLAGRLHVVAPPSQASELLSLVNQARQPPRSCGATAYAAAAPLTLDARLTRAPHNSTARTCRPRELQPYGVRRRTLVGERASAQGYAWSPHRRGHRLRVSHVPSGRAGLACESGPLRQHHGPELPGPRHGRRRHLLDARLRDAALSRPRRAAPGPTAPHLGARVACGMDTTSAPRTACAPSTTPGPGSRRSSRSACSTRSSTTPSGAACCGRR